jgi:two-component system response regulator PilR (NtrC family)
VGADFSEEEHLALARRIKWLLFLRVVILTFFVAAAGIESLLSGRPEDAEAFRSLQLPLIGAYLFSLASAPVLRRAKNLTALSHLQVDFDVLLITGIVSITGGVHSPFPFLYNLAVLNGAILLFHRGAFTTALFASVCYGALLAWSGLGRAAGESGAEVVMDLLVNIPGFFIIAFLGGFLARRVYDAERKLREKQKEYLALEALKETLLHGIGRGIAVTDLAGKISYLNRHAQSLTGLSETAIAGKSLSQVFANLQYPFDPNRPPTSTVACEFDFAGPRGEARQLQLTLAPLRPADERAVGYVAIFEDVTKQKELEEKVRIEQEIRRSRERELPESRAGGKESFRFDGLMGTAGGMDKIYRLIEKIAATNTSVLITGESGTGKELVARAIHYNGPRRARPFVAVNCGAIPENLIESELFGHVRGAFTGAVADRDGLFKQADGGTIFLDEVGELPLHLQVKLLRALQEKTFTAVGGSKPIKVDVRVVSASNKDLRKEVEKGRFREDLFYRLNVVHIALPPLRERREDIPRFVQYFVEKFAGSLRKDVEEVSSDALLHLMNYSYPGNIRELENIIERAVAVTGKNIITEEDLPPYVKSVSIAEEVELFEKTAPGGAEAFFGKRISLDEELATHEKCLLLSALKRANGVQKRAAELLGINYRSFRHRLEKHGLLNSKSYQFADESKGE